MLVLGAMGFLGAGLILSGCKSAPELTQAQAQAMIQAKYDQMPAMGADIAVDEPGLGRGTVANYWSRTTVYPNRFQGDFTLTPEGKKILKLQKGGDVIQWRPQFAGDKNYVIIVETLAASHLKAHVISDPRDDVGDTKIVDYTESVNLDGLPNDLQIIAQGNGNRLSSKHMATFALDGGAWKLQRTN
jgi:hypothetical protein